MYNSESNKNKVHICIAENERSLDELVQAGKHVSL